MTRDGSGTTADHGDGEALLAWYIDAGADEAVSEEPVDRFAAARPAARRNIRDAVRTAPAPGPAMTPRTRALPQSHEQTFDNARQLAAGATTLDELRAAFESFEGCALKATAQNFVFADGNPEAGLMFIGEAPGADEDRQGLPFVGAAGKLLNRMLRAIDIDREQAYITNIIPWRPPGNRTPTDAEVAMCLPFARRHIELVAPRILVPLGAVAAKSLLGTTEGIMRLRGRRKIYRTDDDREISARPMLHPAYLLRRPAAKRETWRDLREIRRDLAGTGS